MLIIKISLVNLIVKNENVIHYHYSSGRSSIVLTLDIHPHWEGSCQDGRDLNILAGGWLISSQWTEELWEEVREKCQLHSDESNTVDMALYSRCPYWRSFSPLCRDTTSVAYVFNTLQTGHFIKEIPQKSIQQSR